MSFFGAVLGTSQNDGPCADKVIRVVG